MMEDMMSSSIDDVVDEQMEAQAQEIAALRARLDEATAALVKIRDTSAAWENRTDVVPYWKLGSMAAAAIVRMNRAQGNDE
jgi:hypothetical protein